MCYTFESGLTGVIIVFQMFVCGNSLIFLSLLVGSIDELLTVFYDAELLDPKLLPTFDESFAQRNFKQICEGKTCIDKFDNTFPQFGLQVYEFDTQAGNSRHDDSLSKIYFVYLFWL